MARDGKRHAGAAGGRSSALPRAAALSPTPSEPLVQIHPLATAPSQMHHRVQLLALIRALARDAARADHAALGPQSHD
jgi:hypothetical protein